MVTEAGSYLRLIDSGIIQLQAQGPSRTCKESKGEEEKTYSSISQRSTRKLGLRNFSSMRGEPKTLQGYLTYKKTHPPRTLP